MAEPVMRERMRDPSIPSYTTTFTNPWVWSLVVLRSEKDGFKAGDYLYGLTVCEAYTVRPYVDGMGTRHVDMDSLALQVVPNPNGLYPLSNYTSIIETPGLTTFAAMEGIIDGKEVRQRSPLSRQF
ncbi:hypothetical protein CVT25_015675 [Psilocybe cyanescens]|uniref:Oxidoreductase N-terminal domain-containing protein n=1 Tax=Psilocybe cyanescens TaxID=93625 RepID=A0A409WSI0_PSICY|nr:hypothetical protein CVT25_015675 [Psilocybe cyanescens]